MVTKKLLVVGVVGVASATVLGIGGVVAVVRMNQRPYPKETEFQLGGFTARITKPGNAQGEPYTVMVNMVDGQHRLITMSHLEIQKHL